MSATPSRDWSPIPWADDEGVVLYDGVCVFCSRWVRFVIDRDRRRLFRFLSIQSPAGRRMATAFGIDAEAPETNAVVLGGFARFKSDAAIAVLRSLPGWRWVVVARLLPRALRDRVYDLIASNRYRLFGRTTDCMVPAPGDRDRFLTDDQRTDHAG